MFRVFSDRPSLQNQAHLNMPFYPPSSPAPSFPPLRLQPQQCGSASSHFCLLLYCKFFGTVIVVVLVLTPQINHSKYAVIEPASINSTIFSAMQQLSWSPTIKTSFRSCCLWTLSIRPLFIFLRFVFTSNIPTDENTWQYLHLFILFSTDKRQISQICTYSSVPHNFDTRRSDHRTEKRNQ